MILKILLSKLIFQYLYYQNNTDSYCAWFVWISVFERRQDSGGSLLSIVTILGTRPEAIKLFPVVDILRRHNDCYSVTTIATGQHRGLFDATTAALGMPIDINLNLQRDQQSLNTLSASILVSLDHILAKQKPNLVLVQGDTQTALMGAMAASFRRIPVAHVEAGLRSGNPLAPFPEEINRSLIARLAHIHFAPTPEARENLLYEGVEPDNVVVTGNTVIDSLKHFALPMFEAPANNQRRAIVTCHRRESWDDGIVKVCAAIDRISEQWPTLDILFILPVAPLLRAEIQKRLQHCERVTLSDPLPYPTFISRLLTCDVVLTDSGGIQEEAPSLGIPTVILRNESDRPEALNGNSVVLAGKNVDDIVTATSNILHHVQPRREILSSPYGDGLAAIRIVNALNRWQRGIFPLLPSADAFAG